MTPEEVRSKVLSAVKEHFAQTVRPLTPEEIADTTSLDENEVATCRLLMEEVFGRNNVVATIAWQRRISPDARLGLSRSNFDARQYRSCLIFHCAADLSGCLRPDRSTGEKTKQQYDEHTCSNAFHLIFLLSSMNTLRPDAAKSIK